MKLGGRISAAIEVLADIEGRRRPVADALKDWGLSHRFAGSGDRGVIGNIVYDALRWWESGAWVMGEATPRGVVLATTARRWGLGPEGLAAALADDPHSPAVLTDAEAGRLAGADLATAPPHVRADVPEWTAPHLERALGPDWIEEGATLAERPPLDLRTNTLKADRAKVLKALANFGAAEVPLVAEAVRIAPTSGEARHPNVQVEPAFQKGWFEVQDAGSQVAAAVAAGGGARQVLDLCAGAGGKTLAIAAALAGKGRIVATDPDRTRLSPIFDRVKRAAAHNVEIRAAKASLDDCLGRMDVVLVDAPCTGSGTWRRRPDAKWRLTERALAARIEEQRVLLPDSARYLRAGGRLVYVTCSLLPGENSDRLAELLAATPELASLPPRDAISDAALPSSLADQALLTDLGMTLTPRRTATDGFFIGVLRRQ